MHDLIGGKGMHRIGEAAAVQGIHEQRLQVNPLHQLTTGGTDAQVRAVELCQFALSVWAMGHVELKVKS